MDPSLASPFPSTAQISNHEVLLLERRHSIEPSELPRVYAAMVIMVRTESLHTSKMLSNYELFALKIMATSGKESIFVWVHGQNLPSHSKG